MPDVYDIRSSGSRCRLIDSEMQGQQLSYVLASKLPTVSKQFAGRHVALHPTQAEQ
jgi:hypothetical protein